MAKKLPKIMSQVEFEKIFKACKNKEVKLAMLLGFEAGLRISEIVGLRRNISKCCKKDIKIVKQKNKSNTIYCMGCEKELIYPQDVVYSKNEWTIYPLTKDKIDLDGNSIRIFGKGKKERIVPLPKRFTTNALKMLPLKAKRRTLQYHVTTLGKKILGKEISFHTLRHGFGSHLAGRNVPLHEIQMLMGHSRLDTTGVYLHANPVKALEGARDVF